MEQHLRLEKNCQCFWSRPESIRYFAPDSSIGQSLVSLCPAVTFDNLPPSPHHHQCHPQTFWPNLLCSQVAKVYHQWAGTQHWSLWYLIGLPIRSPLNLLTPYVNQCPLTSDVGKCFLLFILHPSSLCTCASKNSRLHRLPTQLRYFCTFLATEGAPHCKPICNIHCVAHG